MYSTECLTVKVGVVHM